MEEILKKSVKKAYAVLKPVFDMSTEVLAQNTNYKNYAEDYVNSRKFANKTGYFIWIDKSSFKVNIFQRSQSRWKLLKSYLCTIGKPSTPTPNGTYSVGIKGLYFGTEKGFKARYYTQINGNYLFHSILYNLDGSIRDGRLGMALSDGCVRLALLNAKWIYDNIPQGTGIYIS